jgi:hypothetical protein
MFLEFAIPFELVIITVKLFLTGDPAVPVFLRGDFFLSLGGEVLLPFY